jgi:hypothetical protein
MRLAEKWDKIGANGKCDFHSGIEAALRLLTEAAPGMTRGGSADRCEEGAGGELEQAQVQQQPAESDEAGEEEVQAEANGEEGVGAEGERPPQQGVQVRWVKVPKADVPTFKRDLKRAARRLQTKGDYETIQAALWYVTRIESLPALKRVRKLTSRSDWNVIEEALEFYAEGLGG